MLTKDSPVKEWLHWLEQQHPKTIDLGLERVAKAAELFDLQTMNCPVITIAGTNGKGSSAQLLSDILLAANYKVGCYTSPHIIEFNERIRIDDEDVSDDLLREHFFKLKPCLDLGPLTFFEYTTLTALSIFKDTRLDFIILEVGLGGRLDAVNIVDADVALITGIDLDHQDWLGNTREEIAKEKIGIFRAGKHAVCGDPNPPTIIAKTAKEMGVTLSQINKDFGYKNILEEKGCWDWYQGESVLEGLPIPSTHLNNAASVIQVASVLRDHCGASIIVHTNIRTALEAFYIEGRQDSFYENGHDYLDVAHNPQACKLLSEMVAKKIKNGEVKSTIALVGMMTDKDIKGCFQVMAPVIKEWILVDLNQPRAASLEQLSTIAEEMGLSYKAFSSVAEGYKHSKEARTEDDCLVVFGSFHCVGQVYEEQLDTMFDFICELQDD